MALSAFTKDRVPKKPVAALQVQAPLLSTMPTPEHVEEKSTQFAVHDLVVHDHEGLPPKPAAALQMHEPSAAMVPVPVQVDLKLSQQVAWSCEEGRPTSQPALPPDAGPRGPRRAPRGVPGARARPPCVMAQSSATQ